MADVTKLIELLHPMREPPLPDSIVPALVLTALGCMTAALMVGFGLRARRINGLRTAAVASLTASRTLHPAERLAAQAALLRHLVRVLFGEGAAREHGAAWLERLDGCFQTEFFSKGEGRAYGDALYAPQPVPEVEALDHALSRLLSGMRFPSVSRTRPA